ncbi:MAG TPA: hypothetical protein VN622_10990 [Clostridia bacterium]|nr:hypothetical protein [Clostridia bacterium]
MTRIAERLQVLLVVLGPAVYQADDVMWFSGRPGASLRGLTLRMPPQVPNLEVAPLSIVATPRGRQSGRTAAMLTATPIRRESPASWMSARTPWSYGHNFTT